MKRTFNLIFTFILLLSICACSGDSTKNNVDQSTTVEEMEPNEDQVQTQEPTSEPTSSDQFEIPDSITYSGSGDDVITIDQLEGVFVFHIVGNQEERHFSVKGYDSSGESTELLVNTTSAYEGTTIDPSQKTVMLEIKATGDWSIDVKSIFEMGTISSGETVSGSGDSVILVSSYGSTANISGNTSERHFSVKSYGSESDKLLVNTTEVYEGTVMLIGKPIILEVNAVGEWSISFD